MKKILLLFILLTSLYNYSQNVIIDQTTNTVEQLVTDVLIDSPCANVSNITYSTGTNFGDLDGIGYFSEPTGTFPFTEGIMLASGDASIGGGPNPSIGGESTGGIGWPGDADLTSILTNPADGTNNASVIEFDFVPIASEISFRFLMASEEYDQGSFECTYSDVFGFFLTDQNGVTTNLAVLPGTTLPILVTNVHPDNTATGAPCPGINANLFSQYVAMNDPPIAYDGYTRSFTAFSAVIPGETYHIKLAIADASDTALDTAVFLEAGSFDLGLNLGPDITIADGTALCDGETVTLNTNSPTATHTWYFNGVEIVGETNSTLDVTIDGDYSADVVFSGNCQTSDSIVIEFAPNAIANLALDLNTCNGSGTGQFDLTQNDDDVLGTQNPVDFVIEYFETQADADANINPISNPTTYSNTSNPQTIFVRIADLNQLCYDTTSYNIDVTLLTFNNPISNLEECDDDADGFIQFTLTNKDSEVIASSGEAPANVLITYYETQADADANINALISPYTNILVSNQTIFVKVVSILDMNCYGTTTVDLVVNPLPTLVPPTDLEVCDDGVPDGFTQIDLNIKNSEIQGGNPSYGITYYLNQADADAGTNPLAIPYTNITNPQTVYVRGEDINTGCYSTTTLDLVVEQAPIANIPTPLEFCDPDSDGFGVFTLTDSELEITGGVPGLTVTYHETLSDAQNNVNPLASPYNNIVAYTQTIYVRVESATIATNCATFVDLVLIVHDTPDITDPPTPLELCDDNADGFAQFDLTSKDTEILNGLDPIQYTVIYYETQANAEAQTNAIATPGAYTNITPNSQIIWVRVDDTLTGCYNITTLELIVNALPVLVQPTPLSLCDFDNPGDEIEQFTLEDKIDEILNGQTGITISFHETQLGAENDTDEIFSPYTNIANAQTIYIRAQNDITGCISTITLDLRVEPLPSPATPTPLEVCDDDNDGFMTFDLDSKTIEILNGEPDVTISYHETMADAENAVNPLTSPYANIVEDSQTIYVRAENDLTGCYAIVELQLNVLPSPEVPLEIDDYVICDDNNDGFAQFDLTTMDATILGMQLPTDFILTYHTNVMDAETGANPIVEPTLSNYTNLGNPQTLYVHLESITNSCVDTGEFDLVVFLPPVPVFPTPLDVCDDDYYANWDGIAIFDLTAKDTEITGGNASWTVEYYETDASAQAGMPAIDPANAYQNTVNPQTLYVRVIDGDTGCYAFTTLLIRVNPNPTPQIPLPIELCDDINTGNGNEIFDLTIREIDILNGEAGVSATYYETLEDADSGMNAIVDPTMYTNTSTPQTIYVRVTNDTTGCYTIVELQLIVNPLPEVVAVTDLIECEVNTDGFYDFDLESKTDEILNGQSPTDFMVTYHESLADAQAGVGALVSLYTNTTINTQIIYVNISNTTTGCDIATVSFNIEVQEGAVANMPLNDYVICDNLGDNDGIGQFNLTDTPIGDGYDYNGDLYTEILGGQNSMNYTITFYTTPEDAEAGVNEIPTTYENVTNPQVIYVRVDNDTDNTTICYDTTTLTLQVDELPIFDLEDSYILCVNSPDGVVTTTSAPTIDTGLSPMGYSFEWTDSTGAIVGTGSSFEPSYGDTYGVVVTNSVTGCQNDDMTEVQESSPPDVEAVLGTLAFSDIHTIEVTASGVEFGEYEFSLDDGPWVSNDPNTGSYTFEDVSSGAHTVWVRDVNGCGEDSESVLIMDYPKYFTPNNDGDHDTWNIIGISDQPNAKIYIFDRYGKLLKQLSPTGTGWNGTYNSLPSPTDDYWFTVEYDEPNDGIRKEFKAHFTLKR